MQNENLNAVLDKLVETHTIESVCDSLTEVCLQKADKINKGEIEHNQTARYWVKFARRFQGQR